MKTKKMTFNMLASKVPAAETVELAINDEMTVEVKKRLDMKHSLQFVQDIVSTCFDEEEATYIPEIFDVAIRIATMMHYAGFDVPKDAGKAFAVVYETDVFDRVLAVVDKKQFEELITGAKRKIAFKRDLLATTAAQKAIELLTRLDGIVEKMAEATENVNIGELTDAMKDISEKLNSQIEGKEIDDDNIVVMPRRKEDGE